jgi:hypothetical protein
MEPAELVASLVERVRERAAGSDAVSIRAALGHAISELKIPASQRSAWADGTDVLGTAYEVLLAADYRRTAGQFQTPPRIASLMAAWLLRESPRLLCDPGVGAGRLLYSAAAHPRSSDVRLLGLDTDPLAIAMARMNLALRGRADADLQIHDFLLDQLDDAPDALICNPPYSRHHAIPADVKERIHEGFSERLGTKFSRLSGLHVLFLVRALEVMEDGGVLAFITPSDWLDVGYGQAIKRWVLDRASVEGIVMFGDDHLVFGPNVLTSAAITLIRKTPATSTTAPVVRVPTTAAIEAESVFAALEGRESNASVEHFCLSARRAWARPPRPPRAGRRLAELATIQRGIATGCNRFFVISEELRRKRELPLSDLRPCITTPRLVEGTRLTEDALASFPDGTPRWVINCRRNDAEHEDGPLGRYLRWGKRKHRAHAGYLAQHRSPWYALEVRGPCSVLFTYFNRSQPRFVRSLTNAVPLNTWLIVEPRDAVDPDELWEALQYRSVFEQLITLRRNYAGMWKLEPRELGELVVSLQPS